MSEDKKPTGLHQEDEFTVNSDGKITEGMETEPLTSEAERTLANLQNDGGKVIDFREAQEARLQEKELADIEELIKDAEFNKLPYEAQAAWLDKWLNETPAEIPDDKPENHNRLKSALAKLGIGLGILALSTGLYLSQPDDPKVPTPIEDPSSPDTAPPSEGIGQHVKIQPGETVWNDPMINQIADQAGKDKRDVIADFAKINGLESAGNIQPGWYTAPTYTEDGELIIIEKPSAE